MQLHVPSQPFQASVECRLEGVVVVCALWGTAPPYSMLIDACFVF